MFEGKTPNVFDVGMDQTTQFTSHLCDSIMNHEMHGIGLKCVPRVTKIIDYQKMDTINMPPQNFIMLGVMI
jgi:hypothetical protein